MGRLRELAKGDRGAVMVVGAFMSIFLVGVLYTLAGIGEAAVFQERLQDATDDGVFSAAVIHARAMNTISLVNATMVVIMAALAGYNLAVIAAQLCVDFEIIAFPENFCEELLALHEGHHDAASPGLIAKLREASDAGAAVAEATPDIAGEEAETLVNVRAGPSVRRALLVRAPMAVQRRNTEPLCALANLHAFRLAKIGMGVDMVYRLIGEGDPRIGRGVPHCERVFGGGAITTSPGNLPVGTEPFQVRMIVVGDARRLRGLGSGVRVPRRVIGRNTTGSRTWADGDPDPSSTLVVAQAEYYSIWEHANLIADTDLHSIEEDQFRMDWRARLRRFRVPTGGTIDPGPMSARYREWLETRVLPDCGGACGDVIDELRVANDALH